MKRIPTAALLALALIVPAATATSSHFAVPEKPCFAAGHTGYRITDDAAADLVVRVDNKAAQPDLRLQLTDDAAAADFVLADGDTTDACADVSSIRSIRIDAAADHPDLTVALSRRPAAHKIYVQSSGFTAKDAAALFAVLWHGGSGREFARRD